MVSRDPNMMHESLRERYEWMLAEWRKRYPNDPQPFLTCTYRSPSEQTRLVAEGKSRAAPGQSLHNYDPCYAFDVAFDPDPTDGVGNDITWQFAWFQRWGELAEEVGLEWGGRWAGLVDGPHVQLPMKWTDAKASKVPSMKALPDASTGGQFETLVLHGFDQVPMVQDRGIIVVRGKLVKTERQDKVDIRLEESSR